MRVYQINRYYSKKGLAYRKTFSFKKSRKKATDKYNQKPEVKIKKLNWARSQKGKEAVRRYRQSKKGIKNKNIWYKKWSKTRRGKENLKKWYQKLKEKYPEKYLARTRLNNAIQYKKIKRPKICQSCNKKRKVDGHHHKGYAKKYWYNVLWFCRKCHFAHETKVI